MDKATRVELDKNLFKVFYTAKDMKDHRKAHVKDITQPLIWLI